jgi:purine-binding chemotaxis protein CheW
MSWDLSRQRSAYKGMRMHTALLSFRLQGAWYAVEASRVREILRLPALTLIAEVPNYIIGVVNYRGHIVAVMDLALRLGQPPWLYRLHDHVIVLEQEGGLLGIIVNEVEGVRDIPLEAIETRPASTGLNESGSQLVRNLAKLDTAVIMVLDHEQLWNATAEFHKYLNQPALTTPEVRWQLSTAQPPGHDGISSGRFEAMRLFLPDATPSECEILFERARNLASSLEEQSATHHIPLAIVGLNGEYFGIELETVHEFTDVRRVTPVPCCPNYVVGDMNLRGDILTVVDIRQALQMPVLEGAPTAKVIVVRLGDALVGVLVDQVFDVFTLDPCAFTIIPSATKSVNETYLKGTVSWAGKMLAILDLQKILTNGGLTVDDEV